MIVKFCGTASLKRVSLESTCIFQSLCANNRSQFRAWDDLSLEFTIRGSVHLGRFLSPFVFNFIVKLTIKMVLSSYENIGVDICSDGKFPALEYADSGRLQFFSIV